MPAVAHVLCNARKEVHGIANKISGKSVGKSVNESYLGSADTQVDTSTVAMREYADMGRRPGREGAALASP